jgi:hypothetical protein
MLLLDEPIITTMMIALMIAPDEDRDRGTVDRTERRQRKRHSRSRASFARG